jgi:hypothetical protein
LNVHFLRFLKRKKVILLKFAARVFIAKIRPHTKLEKKIVLGTNQNNSTVWAT